jgi:putative two-component system response regulator
MLPGGASGIEQSGAARNYDVNAFYRGATSPMEILIVDDNAIALELLNYTLASHGYHVISARDGAEAEEILHQRDCQIVITDWVMPVMSGIELCRNIREFGFSRYIYTILLTTRNETADTVEGLSAGADDFISKPFRPLELIARVRVGERIIGLESRDLTIFALAKLAESRDPETGAHLERVRNYSRGLAHHLAMQPNYRDQINAEFVRLIYLTSPLHDIGKVAVPDGVLLKRGRLSPSEFEIMKSHSLNGAATLDAALERFPNACFLRMARDIAAAHHERYDGSGYPAGLVGDQIPLAARIVALADVYDALTSKRVYKDPIDHAKARQIILEASGSQFDPDVVDAFLACESLFLEIHGRFADPVLEHALNID